MDTHPGFAKLDLCSWRTLPVPPLMQLVQSSYASSLHSTHVLLVRTTCTGDDTAGVIYPCLELLLDQYASGRPKLCRRCCSAISERLGRLLDPGLLASRNCAAGAAASAVSERLGPLLDPNSPGRHELCRRCCGFCSSRRLGPLPDLGSPGKHEVRRQRCSCCSLRTCRVLARSLFN